MAMLGVNQRDPIISRARVVIMTPDVCHAWMTRRADSQGVRQFLARLRNVIIDEAHVYEDVFGFERQLSLPEAGDSGHQRREPQTTPVRGCHRHHPQSRGAHAEAHRAGIRGGEREQ